MTDVNSIDYQFESSRISDENNSSFLLNESHLPMDIDDEIIPTDSPKLNGHRSLSQTIENDEQDKEDVFHLGNPILNKSFDVLPQIKDDSEKNIDEVELSNDKNLNVFTDVQPLLSNQFSVEYPYVIPHPVENTQPSTPNLVETVTTLTKNMKLNVNKTLEGQEPSTPSSTTDKTFDTNTIVLKRKERRKMTTPATENSFNATVEDSPPELCNKQSPFNTPSVSLDTPIASRPVIATIASQQPLMDPTRIM